MRIWWLQPFINHLATIYQLIRKSSIKYKADCIILSSNQYSWDTCRRWMAWVASIRYIQLVVSFPHSHLFTLVQLRYNSYDANPQFAFHFPCFMFSSVNHFQKLPTLAIYFFLYLKTLCNALWTLKVSSSCSIWIMTLVVDVQCN